MLNECRARVGERSSLACCALSAVQAPLSAVSRFAHARQRDRVSIHHPGPIIHCPACATFPESRSSRKSVTEMLVDEPENEAEWQLLGACEAAHWKFYRPKPADPPSHHLYIPNIAHLSEEELLALLRPFGRVLGICRNTETLHAGDSYVNVTFATVEAADAALRGLDRRVLPQTQGKPLRLFPSVLHKEKKVRTG